MTHDYLCELAKWSMEEVFIPRNGGVGYSFSIKACPEFLDLLNTEMARSSKYWQPLGWIEEPHAVEERDGKNPGKAWFIKWRIRVVPKK